MFKKKKGFLRYHLTVINVIHILNKSITKNIWLLQVKLLKSMEVYLLLVY